MAKFAVLLILTISVFELNDVTAWWGRRSRPSRSCPNIVSRSGWNADSPTRVLSLSSRVPYVIIHHSVTPSCSSQSSCARRVKNIQNYHMDNRGWDDIAYNFLIGGDGTVFEGRGWDRVGEHTIGYNSRSIGICLIGNFEEQQPTSAQIESAKNLIWCGVYRHKISSFYTLEGHRDVDTRRGPTLCPGRNLHNDMQFWAREEPYMTV